MTPPKVDKVDIRPLDTLYLENLMGVEPREIAKLLKGSDLAIDTKSGELQLLLAGGQTAPANLETEISWVQVLRDGDANGDKSLDLNESQKILAANLAPEQMKGIDPKKFQESIALLMKNRYAPISANIKAWQAESAFGPTLDAIKLYNKGIYIDELSLANRTLSVNAVGKTATNALFFVPSLVHNIWGDSPLLIGDAAASSAADDKNTNRAAAIEKLEDAIQQGIRNNESWALEGKLDGAFAKLDESTVSILNTELCASRLHEILTLSDPKERYSRLLAFAEGERPSGILGLVGYGGGNSHISGGWFESLWNLSGRRNNIFFAKTILRFLAAKAATDDANFDKTLDDQSRVTLSDMNGDGGGYMNMAAVGLTNIFCIGGALCEPTKYRDWSDEARMDGLGRGVDGVLMVWGGQKVFNMFGEGNRLRGLKGVRQVASIWSREGGLMPKPLARAIEFVIPKRFSAWKGMKGFNPLPATAWGEAANTAAKEAEVLGALDKGSINSRLLRHLDALEEKNPIRRLDRAWKKITSPLSKAKGAASEWLFKKMPPLSARQLEMLKTASRVPGKGLGKLVKGVMILGIVQYGDGKLSPAFNPFEYGLKDMDREASFDPYPNLTKADPVLHPAPKAK